MKKKEEVLDLPEGYLSFFGGNFSWNARRWSNCEICEVQGSSLITTARIISRRSTQYFSHVSEFYVKKRTFSAAEVLKQVQFGCKCPSSAQSFNDSRPWGASTNMWINLEGHSWSILEQRVLNITSSSFGFIWFPSDHHLNEDGSLLQSPWQNKVSLKSFELSH